MVRHLLQVARLSAAVIIGTGIVTAAAASAAHPESFPVAHAHTTQLSYSDDTDGDGIADINDS